MGAIQAMWPVREPTAGTAWTGARMLCRASSFNRRSGRIEWKARSDETRRTSPAGPMAAKPGIARVELGRRNTQHLVPSRQASRKRWLGPVRR